MLQPDRRRGRVLRIGDALVGGISLPVDAVGVDLQQGRDAVLVTATGQADALVWASS
jgi:hypothetical protein